MSWLILLLAGLFEIGFVVCLKLSDGFSKLVPTVAFATCAILSFLLLSQAIRQLPVGTCYAVWTGIGAVGAVVFGIILFRDPVSFSRLFFVGLLVVSLVGLKVVSPA